MGKVVFFDNRTCMYKLSIVILGLQYKFIAYNTFRLDYNLRVLIVLCREKSLMFKSV